MRGILGADVFAALLLVFIFMTGLLLMNINKMGGQAMSASIESNLPKIQLPKGSSGGLPGGKAKNSVNLSARKTGEEIQYFINDKPVRYADLPVTFKTGQISSVRIRFDRNISYGHYVEILNLCKQAGITDIINVYTTRT
jgi:biopolymer transport protein ExbD